MGQKKKYKKYEMESAMIKMIRRCNMDAMYWAFRLSNAKGGPQIIWDRLEIMSAEDIGMAYPWLRTYLYQQQQAYRVIEDEASKQRVLLDTVHFFTKQNKSRLCDNIAHAYFKDEVPEVEEVHIDELMNAMLKAIDRSAVDDILKYAAQLYQLKKEALIIDSLRPFNDPETIALVRYFETQNAMQRDYHDLLFLINLLLYKSMDWSIIPIKFDIEPLDFDAVYNDNRILEVPDFAYDYHCTIGRNLGRGYQHYYEHGALINQCFIEDPYEARAKRINYKKDKN